MGRPHTIIGAKWFHFRVQDGFGWFTLAMAARKNGALAFLPTKKFRKLMSNISVITFVTYITPKLLGVIGLSLTVN